jgi:hypothetical protein
MMIDELNITIRYCDLWIYGFMENVVFTLGTMYFILYIFIYLM